MTRWAKALMTAALRAGHEPWTEERLLAEAHAIFAGEMGLAAPATPEVPAPTPPPTIDSFERTLSAMAA